MSPPEIVEVVSLHLLQAMEVGYPGQAPMFSSNQIDLELVSKTLSVIARRAFFPTKPRSVLRYFQMQFLVTLRGFAAKPRRLAMTGEGIFEIACTTQYV